MSHPTTKLQKRADKASENAVTDSDKPKEPRCLELFERGITTCSQLATAMSVLMADLISERVGTSVGNAVCNAGAKMLKAVEMQHRFGSTQSETGKKELSLIA